jgi:hypothetical protein
VALFVSTDSQADIAHAVDSEKAAFFGYGAVQISAWRYTGKSAGKSLLKTWWHCIS